ncbi:MAG: type IV secretory system conjugative DNA transfer family protein [Candidatus Competibacteraceae bacterium]
MIGTPTPRPRFHKTGLSLALLLCGSAVAAPVDPAAILLPEAAIETPVAEPPAGLAPLDGANLAALRAARHDQGELRLEDVKSGRSLRDEGAINPIRAEALKESALAYGARAGLYARAREINRTLDAEAVLLDQNFPFAPLILAHNVLPPVIQTARDTARKHGDARLRFADAVYEIVAPAKLAVAPPDWRTYLYVRANRPEPPDETLLPDPSKAAEAAYWERCVERGWRRGVMQADQTFTVQLNRLTRDLAGMALYRELLAKNMVTAPRLTEQQRGVTTDRNLMRVNDRVLEIAENTRFQADDQRWTPYPTRPYRPPKQAPKIDVRVLGTAPAPPIASTAWERPPWDR